MAKKLKKVVLKDPWKKANGIEENKFALVRTAKLDDHKFAMVTGENVGRNKTSDYLYTFDGI